MSLESVVEVPLSAREREIVTACLMSDHEAPYNVPVFVDFDEPVDEERLFRAVRMTVEACPELCRAFRRDGTRLFATPATPVVERVEVLSSRAVDDVGDRRIPVLDTPLVHAAVISVRDTGRTRLYLNAHHAVVDGISLALLLHTIADAYLTGAPPAFPRIADAAEHHAAPRAIVGTEHLAMSESSEAAAAFVTALHGMREAGVGTVQVRRTVRAPERTGFAASLGAVVPALSVWTDTRSVLLSTALVGRDAAHRAAIGNFVRLQPLVFDVDAWPLVETPVLRRELGSLAVGMAIRATVPLSSGSAKLSDRIPATSVVFDYGTQSLVPRRIHEDLPGRIVEDDSYVDPKYGLHLSVDQDGDEQSLTLVAEGIPAHRLEQLAWLYAQQLRYGPLRSAPPESFTHPTELAASA